VSPSTTISPLVGCSIRTISRPSVDFPHPLSPTMPSVSAFPIASDSSSCCSACLLLCYSAQSLESSVNAPESLRDYERT